MRKIVWLIWVNTFDFGMHVTTPKMFSQCTAMRVVLIVGTTIQQITMHALVFPKILEEQKQRFLSFLCGLVLTQLLKGSSTLRSFLKSVSFVILLICVCFVKAKIKKFCLTLSVSFSVFVSFLILRNYQSLS